MPREMATTDPALFATWRAAVTKYHLKGWTHMTPERVDAGSIIAVIASEAKQSRPHA
jgi:hypothetical protein